MNQLKTDEGDVWKEIAESYSAQNRSRLRRFCQYIECPSLMTTGNFRNIRLEVLTLNWKLP